MEDISQQRCAEDKTNLLARHPGLELRHHFL